MFNYNYKIINIYTVRNNILDEIVFIFNVANGFSQNFLSFFYSLIDALTYNTE